MKEHQIRLPISTCRIRARGGASVTSESVVCPERGRSVDIDECLACVHCTHLRLAGPRDSFLGCDREWPEAPAPPRDVLGTATVDTIMTRVVHCARGDLTLRELAGVLVDTGVGGVPVVDGHRHVIGVVSKTDLVQSLHDGLDPATTTVADVMAPLAFVLLERASIERAAALMATEGVHRLPVVAPDGTLVGIVTALDVARSVARDAGLGT